MHSFVRKVKEYIDKHQLIKEGDRLLIACSGGADSLALVHVLNNLKEIYHVEIGIAHADHQLRGEESAEDSRFVERFAANLNIPFFAATLEVPKRVAAEGGNVQVICREERYSFFEKTMKIFHYTKLVLGHHADDQIESVIMSLARGSNSSTITGIPRSRPFSEGHIIRPFLCITKKEIFEYIHLHKLSFRHDPSNDKHTYTRNRIRHTIVPLLKEENPNISDSIHTFVEKQKQDEEFLQSMAKRKYEQLVTIDQDGVFFLDTKCFIEVPIALQRRVILLLLKYLYKNSEILLNDHLIDSILAACNKHDGNITIHLPQDYFLVRHYNKVQFSSGKQQPIIARNVVEEDSWITIGAGYSIYLTRNLTDAISGEKWFVQLENDCLPLLIRQREEGDRIQIKGMNSPKKISRVFIDEKISAQERREWPLLVTSKNEIIAVIGLRYGERFSKKHYSQNYVLYIKRD
ncbi:tRNA lysidine(34) synthetase TilS [Psychrobacillus lasiicapitis]|uniref:tRNA(Ile)-lysidine synthase n=1 Tax=Psychrobacillus lasiicapitis TaxID=1636719 RepID=A0A544SSY8_9BACI|nr:tRNA lysidine(34) synthetase TilS [Psychrobacillus lasiicapitis]TQR08297.1 tRNA lysidine(34) synthetase TilS [Psychrobacillus lasiicapitis]GGA48449.1 tRNA(Ile)-lysidine synthase [Psychrobacillus lasiicapitis]